MSLIPYNKKRDFSKTSEPQGKISKDNGGLFVIQKHAASHLHYDFRLELQGVLKSWAIPKGPSLNPKTKRLAIHVEDHPLAYANFEGTIPKGQYGAGTVVLWDEGTWEALDDKPIKAYEKGHLRFNLHGKKLNGRWDLIRFKDDKHWFLIKFNDDYAQLDGDITTKPSIDLPKEVKKTEFPEFIPPELATLVDKVPKGDQWLHEIKFDGYRILAFKNGDNVSLKSRNNKDWTQALQSIADAVSELPFKQVVLDGEVVVLDKKGRSDFQLLQQAIKNLETSFIYYLFDVLYVEGYDLRQLPLIERKTILKQILAVDIPHLHYSDHIPKEGQALFEYSCQHKLEGIVSKRKDGVYLSKRSKEWLKVKCINRQEFVIGGYTPPKGTRSYFGSLLLGVYHKNDLIYAGNVGTGFNFQSMRDIYQLLLQHQTEKKPFSTTLPDSAEATWVKPELVCEVAFTEWTQDNHLRHPSFKGMRLDKKAKEVIHEYPNNQS